MPQGPAMPDHGARLWNLFQQLHGARAAGPMGVGAITWGEIHAFQQVTGLRLEGWEAEGVRALDETYMASRAGPAPTLPAPPAPPPIEEPSHDG